MFVFISRLFSRRFLQGELRHGQLDGSDQTTARSTRGDTRAQPRSVDIRRVPPGDGGSVGFYGANTPGRVSTKREQYDTVVFGVEVFFNHKTESCLKCKLTGKHIIENFKRYILYILNRTYFIYKIRSETSVMVINRHRTKPNLKFFIFCFTSYIMHNIIP